MAAKGKFRNWEVAVANLLTCETLEDAAKASGISANTLLRWLQREDFQAAYRKAKREAVNQAIAKIQQVSVKAVTALEEVLAQSDKPSSKVAAARTVLEFAMKAIELEELEERVKRLEEAIEGNYARREA